MSSLVEKRSKLERCSVDRVADNRDQLVGVGQKYSTQMTIDAEGTKNNKNAHKGMLTKSYELQYKDAMYFKNVTLLY